MGLETSDHFTALLNTFSEQTGQTWHVRMNLCPPHHLFDLVCQIKNPCYFQDAVMDFQYGLRVPPNHCSNLISEVLFSTLSFSLSQLGHVLLASEFSHMQFCLLKLLFLPG